MNTTTAGDSSSAQYPLQGEKRLTWQIAEVLHYCTDLPRALDFYHQRLGWPIIWQSPGSMAMLDAGGAYHLTILAAKWVDGWEEGMPAPAPVPALVSKDLHADTALLGERGLAGLEVSGDPESMLCLDLTGPEGIKFFVWQDTKEAAAAKVFENYHSNPKQPPLYSLGECVLFVNDLEAAEAFCCDKLGFTLKERCGSAYSTLRIADGPILGLYHWPQWWEAPVASAPASPVRLFFECANLAAEHERQTANGVAPNPIQQQGQDVQWFNTADPDGAVMIFWQYGKTG